MKKFITITAQPILEREDLYDPNERNFESELYGVTCGDVTIKCALEDIERHDLCSDLQMPEDLDEEVTQEVMDSFIAFLKDEDLIAAKGYGVSKVWTDVAPTVPGDYRFRQRQPGTEGKYLYVTLTLFYYEPGGPARVFTGAGVEPASWLVGEWEVVQLDVL